MESQFYSNIKNYRISKGYSMSELARKLKVNVSTVSRWEKHEISVNLDAAEEVAKILNIPLPDLLGKKLFSDNISEISPSEFSKETKSLLLKTSDLTNAEKEYIINTLDLICKKNEQ